MVHLSEPNKNKVRSAPPLKGSQHNLHAISLDATKSISMKFGRIPRGNCSISHAAALRRLIGSRVTGKSDDTGVIYVTGDT